MRCGSGCSDRDLGRSRGGRGVAGYRPWSRFPLVTDRVLRFTELKREIDGVSQRMLTVTLRQLERDGLVKRTVHPVVPPRVEYELTPLGGTLHTTIRSLVTWTEQHQNEIAAAREEYDAKEEAAAVA
ncbi:winged helix-turn-helix transcriptional regulator [Streptomyces sp. NPDC055103]